MPDHDVSRETPPVPEAARGVFPHDRRPLAERYVELLATDGVVRGLIGPREAPRLWDRHVLNSAVLADVLDEGVSVCDVGSGAGLPGIPLAIARPDLQVTLLEPLLRRTTFLNEVVEELGLSNVEVLRGRAEEQKDGRTWDVVTSRAVAPVDRLLTWCMPLVSADGAMVCLKGGNVLEEIDAAERALARLGCSTPETFELGHDVLSTPTCGLRVRWDRQAQATVQGRNRKSSNSRSRRSHGVRRPS